MDHAQSCFNFAKSFPVASQNNRVLNLNFANGGIQRVAQSTEFLLKMAKEAEEDCYLELLNHCNTPGDEVFGSPTQKLMARRIKTKL